jgi:hypothetical protein
MAKFYSFVFIIAIFLIVKTYTYPSNKNSTIDVDVYIQKNNIKQLFDENLFLKESLIQLKQTKNTIHFSVDSINFPQENELFHHKTGFLGLKKDFFMQLKTSFMIQKSYIFQFSIRSDDGFVLRIDNKIICKHLQPREMKQTLCANIKLDKGEHKLVLDYFQGYGQMGLMASYKIQTNNLSYYIGNSSEKVTFLPVVEH